jgi:biotin carboxyl carrier protein
MELVTQAPAEPLVPEQSDTSLTPASVAASPKFFVPVTRIGYPVMVNNAVTGAVAFETSPNPARAAELLRHLHWGLGWIVESLQRRMLEQRSTESSRILSVMESVATALRPGKLREILFEISNDVSRKLECARMGIALVDHEKVTLQALSDTAWIEKATVLAKQYVAAMEEAHDARTLIVYPPLSDVVAETATIPSQQKPDEPLLSGGFEKGAFPCPQHAALLNDNGATSVVSVPLLLGVRCIGVITLEWHGTRNCTALDLAWLQAFTAMLPSIIEDKRRAEQGFLGKLATTTKDVAAKIFGPKHLVWKAATALVVLTVAILALVQIDYRVSAKTIIEGETQRVAAVPFEGFIASAFARAGDTVAEGQVLAQLDDRDLKAELAKWTSERDQYERKLREAMANHEMSAYQITDAQYKQADAQVKLTTERLQRSTITAPYKGIVVSGDLSQLIGSPVEQGKKLFEIAPLDSYRVILQVDEREIRHVKANQTGKLLVAGIAEDPIAFTVVKVTPVATAQDGKNFFRVEARLHKASPRLRPGMEGVGKISTGDQRLWTVLTHSFTDWLRLAIWNWML